MQLLNRYGKLPQTQKLVLQIEVFTKRKID